MEGNPFVRSLIGQLLITASYLLSFLSHSIFIADRSYLSRKSIITFVTEVHHDICCLPHCYCLAGFGYRVARICFFQLARSDCGLNQDPIL